MKYYSEVLNKFFDKEADLISAEEKQKENDSEATILREKVRETRKAYEVAAAEYLECLRQQSKNKYTWQISF